MSPSVPDPLALALLVAATVVSAEALVWRIRLRAASGRVLGVDDALALGIGAAFVGAAVAVPEWGAVHDHGIFVRRADCAYAPDCVHADPWTPVAMRALGVIYRLFGNGYGTDVMSVVSLAFAVGALFAMRRFLEAALRRSGRADEAPIAGLVAMACVAANPMYLRMAVSGAFWPYVMFFLFAAGCAALRAVERRTARDWLVAAVFLALATASNWAVLPWGLLGLSPICFGGLRGRPTARRAAVAVAGTLLFLALVVPTLPDAAAMAADTGARRRDGWVLDSLLLEPRVVPLGASLLWLVGVLSVATGRSAALLPLFAAQLLSDPTLNSEVDLVTGYPTRFIHGFPSLMFIGAFAGVGTARLARGAGRLAQRGSAPAGRRHRAARAAVVAASVVGIGVGTYRADAAWRFLHEPNVLTREYAALEDAFERLPEHDLLLVAGQIQSMIGGNRDADPVEVTFPRQAYMASLRRRGLHDGWVVDRRVAVVEDLLASGARPDGEVLVYVGSSLRAWARVEIAAGDVPANTIDRPPLQALREVAELEPVLTFELPTEQTEHFEQRLAADRAPTVELGFYRVVWREGATGTAAEVLEPNVETTPATVFPAERAPIVGALFADWQDQDWTIRGIAIDRDVARATLEQAGGGGPVATFELRHPDLDHDVRTPSFGVRSAGPPEAEAALQSLLEHVRGRDDGAFWGAE